MFAVIISSTMLIAAGGELSGTVADATTGESIIGANVFLEGTTIGAATDAEGTYIISNIPVGQYVLNVSFIGYAKHSEFINITEGVQLEVNIELKQTEIMGDLVVVSGSRKVEKITEAPATIGVITAKDFDEYAGNAGELFGRIKGVDYIRTGIGAIGINVRGFNSAFNPKMLQMNDNRFSNLIATGLAYGPLSTAVRDDVDRTEVILGPSSALYGPNAMNGLVYTVSKDPRQYPGTTLAITGGNQSSFGGRFRFARVLNEQFALKITGEYVKATEFDYTDTVYIGSFASEEIGIDRDVNSIHGEAALYFSPTKESDIIVSYGGSQNNYLSVTNAGRNQIKDWTLHIAQLRYVSPRIFGQAYYTWSNTEDTYALNQRTQNYWSFKNAGFSEEESLERSFTEQWVALSDTTGISLLRGAVFKDDSRRFNGELQYNNTWSGFNVIVGGQYQLDMAGSKATYLIDDSSSIDLNQVGFYAQIEKEFGNGFKGVVAARFDDHESYGSNFIPKAAILHTSEIGTFRITYGKGIAAPTILNLSMNIFGGLVLGNGEGFTLSDGSMIEPLEVETINTFEVGYKGVIDNKLYIDVNGYYNISENFISPLNQLADLSDPANLILVTMRGDRPISDFQTLGGAFVLTYLNFGKVNTYGIDLGLNYYFSNNINMAVNYSYFDFSLDEDDPKNDGNNDGVVDKSDLSLNTPTHKGSVGVFGRVNQLYGSVFGRWVQAYNFFSGINVASETLPGTTYGGSDVVEGQRVGRDFNEGPLGDFFNIDLTLGYYITNNVTISGTVVNVFDSEVREFVAGPSIGRLFTGEIKVFIQ